MSCCLLAPPPPCFRTIRRVAVCEPSAPLRVRLCPARFLGPLGTGANRRRTKIGPYGCIRADAPEVIVITHEGARREEWSPYMATACRPHVPVVVFGRSARQAPSCHARESVWHAWESVVLPLCCDPSFPEDTVFIVAEEDFRFHEADEVLEELLEGRAQTAYEVEALARHGARALPGRGGAAGLGARPKAAPAPRRQPGPVLDSGFTREFKELVALCNVAARAGAGDLVWAGWMPSHKAQGSQKWCPTWGTHMVCVTRAGAEWLRGKCAAERTGEYPGWCPGHWDLWLKRWLVRENRDHGPLKYCWPFPSVGSFRVHESGCQPGLGNRPSEWRTAHVQELTEPGERWLAKYTGRKNKPGWIVQLPEMGDEAVGTWVTERPYPLPSGLRLPFPKQGLRVDIARAPYLPQEPDRRPAELGEYWRAGDDPLTRTRAAKRRRDSPRRIVPTDATSRPWLASSFTARQKRARRKALGAYCRFRHFANEAGQDKERESERKRGTCASLSVRAFRPGRKAGG